MPKLKKKSNFFRPVHLQAIIFLIFYNAISKIIFFKSIVHKNLLINFFGPYLFACIAGVIFLYLLRHEDFFHFMKEVEKVEEKKEKSFVRKYLHHGKILATLVITTIGGPIFGALTIRFLFPRYRYSFLVLCIGNIFSTAVSVMITKGVLHYA